MEKNENLNDYQAWYDLWLKQSNVFFELTQEKLKGLFATGPLVDPKQHIEQLQQWLDALKNQWKQNIPAENESEQQQYWQMMGKLCNDATDSVLDALNKHTRERGPVKNATELYQLWLNCCQEVYQKAVVSPAYQNAYGEWLQTALKFWKTGMTGR